MNLTKYLTGQHNMRPAITTGKTRHVPFININSLLNLHKYINIIICSSSFLPCLQNLIHFVAKDEKVTACNDLIEMNNHRNISKSEASWWTNEVEHYFTIQLQNSNKLRFSSDCQNEMNRSFFVCFSIYPSYLNYILWYFISKPLLNGFSVPVLYVPY